MATSSGLSFADSSFNADKFAQENCRAQTTSHKAKVRAELVRHGDKARVEKDKAMVAHHSDLVRAVHAVTLFEANELVSLGDVLAQSGAAFRALQQATQSRPSQITSRTPNNTTQSRSPSPKRAAPPRSSELLRVQLQEQRSEYTWITRVVEDLSMLIAERKFAQCVTLVERIRRVQNKNLSAELSPELASAVKATARSIEVPSIVGALVDMISEDILSSDLLDVADEARVKAAATASASADATMQRHLREQQHMNKTGSSRGTNSTIGGGGGGGVRNATSVHPVRLLVRLGCPAKATRCFLARKSSAVNAQFARMLQSGATEDPESCLRDLSQQVFRVVLETYRDGLSLIGQVDHHVGSDTEHNVAVRQDLHVLLPLLTTWIGNVVEQFCDHFSRLTMPGYLCNSAAVMAIQTTKDGELQGDSNNESVIHGINGPIDLSQGNKSDVPLTEEEWRTLGACLRWTMVICRRLEKDFLSLGVQVATHIRGPLCACVVAEYRLLGRSIDGVIRLETWELSELRIAPRERPPGTLDRASSSMQSMEAVDSPRGDHRVMVTASVHQLYDLMQSSIRNIKRVLSPHYATTEAVQSVVIECTLESIRKYVKQVIHEAGAYDLRTERKKSGRVRTLEDEVMQLLNPSSSFEGNSDVDSGDTPADGVKRDNINRVVMRKGYTQLCEELSDRAGRPLNMKEKRVVALTCSNPFSDTQLLSQISDVLCVRDDLVWRVQGTLERAFKRSFPVFTSFVEEELDTTVESDNNGDSGVGGGGGGAIQRMCLVFARRSAERLKQRANTSSGAEGGEEFNSELQREVKKFSSLVISHLGAARASAVMDVVKARLNLY